MKLLRKKSGDYLPVIITGAVLLICWEGVVRGFSISRWLLPAPSSIIRAMISQRGLLYQHSLRTLSEAISGLLLSTVMGVIVGGLIFYFRFLQKTFYPFLVVSQTIPIVILAPLLVIWFGYGITPKLIIVVLACFFPITINTVDGLAAADREQIALLRSMGAGSWDVFRLVRIPTALPMVISGLRIAATYAVMAAVVAEWMGSDLGLGVYIIRSSNSYLTDRVFAGIILVSLFSILFFQGIKLLEFWLIPWHNQ